MRWLAAVLSSVLLTVPALADPLAIATIPAGSRWVIHIDVDAGRKTPIWDLARARVEAQREPVFPRLEGLERLTGLNLPEDLHDVSLYGASYDENAACILVHAAIDRERTVALLKTDKDFSSEEHHGHTILSWRDKEHDRLLYGAFAANDVAILAHTPAIVEAALDALDGKAATLKPDSPLAPSAAAGSGSRPFFWIAGTDISELARLQKTESPLVGQMDAAAFGGAWSDDKFLAHFRVTARTDKSAQQMLALAEGMKALVALAASDEHATPAAKVASGALQGLSLTAEGKQVTGDLGIDIDHIQSLIDIAKQEALPAVSAHVTIKAAAPADNKP